MNEDFSFTIEIPSDDEGFVLMQCPQCGELFKLRPSDYESDDVDEVCCPSCGIASDNYFTEDVIELAMAKTKNLAMTLLHDEMKKIEKETKGKHVSFKAGKKPVSEEEPSLSPSVDVLDTVTCSHCSKESKVSKLLKMSVYVCPFCGVSSFNER